MKSPLFIALAVILVATVFVPDDVQARPREEDTKGLRPVVSVPDELRAEGEALLESMGMAPAAAAVDTYCIVWYDFEHMDLQGWSIIDETAQIDTFFHVDDFAGLGGGDFGRLQPIEGTKSAWCGMRPGDDFYMCTWQSAPGYGNSWDQVLTTDSFSFTGLLTFSYHGVFDSEDDWDKTYVEYCAGEDWTEIMSVDGVLDTVALHVLPLPLAATKLRFHFISDGSWSDHDGLFDTDGACIIDSITVADINGLIDFEDFESAEVGGHDTDFWHCRAGVEPFGTYTGLAANLQDKDPCGNNMGSQIVFFLGSPWMSDDYPGMPVTPFCAGGSYSLPPCQDITVVSPVIEMTKYSGSCDEVQDLDIPAGKLPELGGVLYRFAVYRDLPLSNLVFYNWAVLNIVDGCPTQWRKRTSMYYGGDREYIQMSHNVSDLIFSDQMQCRLAVYDMCEHWYGTYGDCAEHTPAPYFDNVRVYRYSTAGPQWSVRNFDLFQDTFPQDGDEMESFCRADMANDVAPGDEFSRIDPGDSAVVSVGGWYGGELDTLPTGEAMAYFHCNVHFLGPDGKPDLTGPQLEGTYGSWLSTDGGGWDIFLCEPAATSAGNIVPDRYAIDLNDSLFTRGYMVEYYFKAYALGGISTTYPHNAEEPDGDRYEFTCLPTLRLWPGVLYCDDFHNRGTFEGLVQLYMEPALKAAFPDDIPVDRYDTNGPSSGVGNGIGAYVSASSPSSIFCTAYQMVVHDSGDLNAVTITEGTENSDKSNDAQLLVDWTKNSLHNVGLLIMGDQVAYDLSQSASAVAAELTGAICGINLVNASYYYLTGGNEAGGVVNPLVRGVAGGPYDGLEYYADSGCPIINDFDVLEVTGPGQYALAYPDYSSTAYYAGIYTDQLNYYDQLLTTVWVGHSIMHIRTGKNAIPARNNFMGMTLQLFQTGSSSDWTGTELPKVTSLSDNFPNPFNPKTRINFSLSRKSHVRLRIYDVAGRLLRVLIDETRNAGTYSAVWDGKNENGHATASGVYFCRMEANEYERTLKMVLLR
jgi:hypothetical protein